MTVCVCMCVFFHYPVAVADVWLALTEHDVQRGMRRRQSGITRADAMEWSGGRV